MVLMLKANQIFVKCFHDNAIKIVLILAPGRKFFLASYVQFPLTFTE